MNKDEEIKYESEDDTEKAEHKIKKGKDKLHLCEQERAEYLAGWQRAKADLINYKKEQEAKISEIFKFANEGLIYEILPVLDSFELAIKHPPVGGQTPLSKRREGTGVSQKYLLISDILPGAIFPIVV